MLLLLLSLPDPSHIVSSLLSLMSVIFGSVERLFNQLRVSGHPALEPLVVTGSGALTVQRKYALQTRTLGSLFSDHRYGTGWWAGVASGGVCMEGSRVLSISYWIFHRIHWYFVLFLGVLMLIKLSSLCCLLFDDFS